MTRLIKAQDCEASMEDVAAFLKEQQAKTGELADNELNNVSGGCNKEEAAFSLFTIGAGCAVVAVVSAADDNMRDADGRILCATDA